MNKLKATAFFLILILVNVIAFTASNDSIDVNYGYESDAGGSGNNAGIDANFVSGDYSGNASGGAIDAEIGVYFLGNTNPAVIITSPPNNYSTTSSSITIIYSGSDGDNSIANYWVKIDSNEWINNGLNTQYTFNDLNLGIHSLSVKATDETDLNSSTATINVSVVLPPAQSQGGGTQNLCSNYPGSDVCSKEEYCPSNLLSVVDSTACCSVLCIPRISTQKINSFAQFAAFEDQISNTALNEVYSDSRFEGKRIALPDELIVSRTINSHIVFDKDELISADINVIIYAKNVSEKKFSNISIIESIPKELAETVSDISFIEQPRILEVDPVIEWIIFELDSKQEKEFHYSIKKVNDLNILENIKEFFDSLPTPTAMISVNEADLCQGIQCNDNNPCTQDYCVKGKCYYSNREGMDCAPGKVCYQNACLDQTLLIKEEKEPVIPAVIEKPDDTNLMLIVLGLLITIIGLIVILIKTKDQQIEEEKLTVKKAEIELEKAQKRIEEDEELITKTIELEKELIELKKQQIQK
ncbi:MAG: hypothetical protein JW703_02490 [Candidatus Diapherotrites archaeon]|nr:hypothetical protein [Candidatus Diapherotrites archaeon]